MELILISWVKYDSFGDLLMPKTRTVYQRGQNGSMESLKIKQMSTSYILPTSSSFEKSIKEKMLEYDSISSWEE